MQHNRLGPFRPQRGQVQPYRSLVGPVQNSRIMRTEAGPITSMGSGFQTYDRKAMGIPNRKCQLQKWPSSGQRASDTPEFHSKPAIPRSARSGRRTGMRTPRRRHYHPVIDERYRPTAQFCTSRDPTRTIPPSAGALYSGTWMKMRINPPSGLMAYTRRGLQIGQTSHLDAPC